MKKYLLIGGLASVLALTLVFSSVQFTEAAVSSLSSKYQSHDGSVDEYLTKVTVKPYKGYTNLWIYHVKACATDHNLKVSEVILKSDIEEKVLGVNKTIVKGDCSIYGATMKAKDESTLGAELIERDEAIKRIHELVEGDNKNMSKKDRSELVRLQIITGIYRIP